MTPGGFLPRKCVETLLAIGSGRKLIRKCDSQWIVIIPNTLDVDGYSVAPYNNQRCYRMNGKRRLNEAMAAPCPRIPRDGAVQVDPYSTNLMGKRWQKCSKKMDKSAKLSVRNGILKRPPSGSDIKMAVSENGLPIWPFFSRDTDTMISVDLGGLNKHILFNSRIPIENYSTEFSALFNRVFNSSTASPCPRPSGSHASCLAQKTFKAMVQNRRKAQGTFKTTYAKYG